MHDIESTDTVLIAVGADDEKKDEDEDDHDANSIGIKCYKRESDVQFNALSRPQEIDDAIENATLNIQHHISSGNNVIVQSPTMAEKLRYATYYYKDGDFAKDETGIKHCIGINEGINMNFFQKIHDMLQKYPSYEYNQSMNDQIDIYQKLSIKNSNNNSNKYSLSKPRILRNEMDNDDDEEMDSDDDDDLYSCDTCNKKYTTKGGLKDHQAGHRAKKGMPDYNCPFESQVQTYSTTPAQKDKICTNNAGKGYAYMVCLWRHIQKNHAK